MSAVKVIGFVAVPSAISLPPSITMIAGEVSSSANGVATMVVPAWMVSVSMLGM